LCEIFKLQIGIRTILEAGFRPQHRNYVVTSEFNQIVMNTLSQSQDESGLFKGGDSNDDLVSFRNTYDAVVLCEGIN